MLNIQFVLPVADAQIELVSMLRMRTVLYTGTLQAQNYTFNTTHLSNGIYQLIVKDKNNVYYHKTVNIVH
jgi:hypothetical protein